MDSGMGLFCTLKWNPILGLALPPLMGEKTETGSSKTVAELVPETSLCGHTGKPHYEEPCS